jgi:hypothetical protein
VHRGKQPPNVVVANRFADCCQQFVARPFNLIVLVDKLDRMFLGGHAQIVQRRLAEELFLNRSSHRSGGVVDIAWPRLLHKRSIVKQEFGNAGRPTTAGISIVAGNFTAAQITAAEELAIAGLATRVSAAAAAAPAAATTTAVAAAATAARFTRSRFVDR